MIGLALTAVRSIGGKKWLYIAAGLAAVAAVWWIYDNGRDAERARWEAAQAQQALAVAQEEARRLSALSAAADEAVRAAQREDRQTTIIRERIRTVVDPTGCLDQQVPLEILDALRD